MVLLKDKGLKNKNALFFSYFLAALFLFLLALLFGIIGAFQYIVPGLFKDGLSFEKIRPLHVSSAVFWIILGACGTVSYYLHTLRQGLWSLRLLRLQWYLMATAILFILMSYMAGIFGGREYWEFHPVLAVPIALAWLLFLINIFASVKIFRRQPVYIWMWLTGVVFFFYTYMESYLWLIPSFRANVVQDMTIQWKSYGSMVGGWNMLIYGSGICLMDKISGNEKYSRSKMAFALYFLGLFNLMFNWGHHIYTLPVPKYIQYISYSVSMTELLLLGRIIYYWRGSLTTAQKHYHLLAYRFLFAADLWVFLTLMLAIAMSVPAINRYTHGTHITVAHTMGATIGINSLMLLSFVMDIAVIGSEKIKRQISRALYMAVGALLVFWLSLILAGITKAYWQMHPEGVPFSTMMQKLRPYFIVFLLSGISLASALIYIISHVLSVLCIRIGCVFPRIEEK